MAGAARRGHSHPGLLRGRQGAQADLGGARGRPYRRDRRAAEGVRATRGPVPRRRAARLESRPILRVIGDLTTDWLTDALGVQVHGLQRDRIGTGQMSDSYRVAIVRGRPGAGQRGPEGRRRRRDEPRHGRRARPVRARGALLPRDRAADRRAARRVPTRGVRRRPTTRSRCSRATPRPRARATRSPAAIRAEAERRSPRSRDPCAGARRRRLGGHATGSTATRRSTGAHEAAARRLPRPLRRARLARAPGGLPEVRGELRRLGDASREPAQGPRPRRLPARQPAVRRAAAAPGRSPSWTGRPSAWGAALADLAYFLGCALTVDDRRAHGRGALRRVPRGPRASDAPDIEDVPRGRTAGRRSSA